jgi:hypothetical protein
MGQRLGVALLTPYQSANEGTVLVTAADEFLGRNVAADDRKQVTNAPWRAAFAAPRRGGRFRHFEVSRLRHLPELAVRKSGATVKEQVRSTRRRKEKQ